VGVLYYGGLHAHSSETEIKNRCTLLFFSQDKSKCRFYFSQSILFSCS